MSTSATSVQVLVQSILEQVASNLGTLIDRSFVVGPASIKVSPTRVAGAAKIHLSFKLEFDRDSTHDHGCMLVPLPEAISLAGYLMMLPDTIVNESRKQKKLDREMKDAMLELGNFVGGAVNDVFRAHGMQNVSIRSEGCQGVRPNVAPSFPHEEGSELIIGTAKASIHEFPEFDLVIMIPRSAVRD